MIVTRKQTEKYVRTVADRMGLRDWVFTIEAEEAEDGAVAQVDQTHGQKHANIWFADVFFTKEAAMQRHIVVHELVHCHLAPAQHMIFGSYLRDELGNGRYDVFEGTWRMNLEYGVDGLAAVIAEGMPLP